MVSLFFFSFFIACLYYDLRIISLGLIAIGGLSSLGKIHSKMPINSKTEQLLIDSTEVCALFGLKFRLVQDGHFVTILAVNVRFVRS